MNKGLDKNILMVAVVGIVAVVGLFALLGNGETTGRAVYGDQLYQQCLVRFGDALNVEELCDCKFPMRDNSGRDSDGTCALDAVYPEEEDVVAYEGRGGEGAGGAHAVSRTQRIFATELMEQALAGNYVHPEDWVECKLDGGSVRDCDIFKTGKEAAVPITGNFVNMFKVCLAKEGKAGNQNGDIYCMCRESHGNNCREMFSPMSFERSGFDSCVETLSNNAQRTKSQIGFSSTKDMWRACSKKLVAA